MIYFDYNATTPLRGEVARFLSRAFAEPKAGNPSSIHAAGRDARARLDAARAKVARALGCEPKEVCFTASGSEADALALKGAFEAQKKRGRPGIVTSAIEHPAISGTLAQLTALGARVVVVPPEKDGAVSPQRFIDALEDAAGIGLCSLMWANNETGVLQPVEAVAKAAHARGILFHTDAVQAVGKVQVRLAGDLLSLSAHKFGGPAGVGALLVRRGIDVEALVPGHQEWGRRGGTHNVPYVEALALALELATAGLGTDMERVGALRDRLEVGARTALGARVNGGGALRIPNTTNLHFDKADGEALLIALDLAGICVSAGAACASGTLKPSPVLTAMGFSAAHAHGSLRFSLGPEATEAQVDQVLAALAENVPKARAA